MKRATNARLAGFTFLLYIAIAFPAMVLFGRAITAQGITAKLAGIALHATDVRLSIVASLITCFTALVLAVTLYAITRDQDPDLALVALTCRAGEGILNGIVVLAMLGLLWLGTGAGSDGATLGAFLLELRSWSTNISATFFAVGSLIFSWLLLRGRMIPVALAWVGVLASLLVGIGLPLQLIGVVGSPITDLMWLPMAAFEIPLGVWLIVKGVR
ncbi:MAG: DUF4386 domain-containing protein [Myxococcales bacterium]|nr:DUF4386 domain-containing protein [Myxococcales bacterium]